MTKIHVKTELNQRFSRWSPTHVKFRYPITTFIRNSICASFASLV